MISSIASVVTSRLTNLLLLLVDATPARRREAIRMVTEKLEAACEGALAMHAATAEEARSFWHGPGRRRFSATRWVHAAGRIAAAGRAPARRRLEANRRRLARRRRRRARK